MFKKRAARAQPPRKRERSEEPETSIDAEGKDDAEEPKIDLQELLALRKLQKAHQGIDVARLNKGDTKRKRKAKPEEEDAAPSTSSFGLQPRVKKEADPLDDEEDPDDEETKARKLVRSNNFTQQTNALDVDKHITLTAEPLGAWLIHPLLILLGKLLVDSIPGMHQNASWTIVNLSYMLLSYLMFHYVTGIPFDSDSHGGAYDDLTLWEQIDEGAQYTPAKKWLLVTPIALFLISTHYTHYDPWAFAINFTALLLVLAAKLPQFHRQRLRFLPLDSASGMATPVTPYPPSLPNSGRSTPTAFR